MRRICVLVLIVSLCSAARRPRPRLTARARSALRVYNGFPDTAGRYSYVVALIFLYLRICTGTLITPNWVLTASHCIDNVLATDIQYGNMSLAADETTTKRKILKKFLHPTYKMFLDRKRDTLIINNDIGLLKVETVHLRVYGNVSALDYRTLTGRAVEYAGYGATYTYKTKNPKLVAAMDLRRPVQWGEGLVAPCGFNTQFLCVVPKCSNKEQGVLEGDSGSPLFHDGKIVGVLMGNDRKDPIRIGYFFGISPFMNWISFVISNNL